MKKSIGDNMTPHGWSFEHGLELTNKAGYDGVEIWLGDAPWFQMETMDSAVEELGRKIQSAGLLVSDVSTALHWKYPVSARDPEIRAYGMRVAEREIETAILLRTDAILVVPGLVTEDAPYNEVYARTVEAFQQLAEKAARANIKIGCEPNGCYQDFLLTPLEFSRFLNDINSPYVGVHLDVANAHDTGFPEQWIEILGPRITRIHFRDTIIKRGHSDEPTTSTNPFLGDNNWPAIRAAMIKVGYDGWLIAEPIPRYHYAADQQFYDVGAAMDRFIAGKF